MTQSLTIGIYSPFFFKQADKMSDIMSGLVRGGIFVVASLIAFTEMTAF